jgi:erythritol transport system ATP-binding protein
MAEETSVLMEDSTTVSDDVILTAENISKIFPGTVALDDVTFSVHKGKVNVLIGENGAGKSTLMKILAGVERPSHGRIILDGKEIHLHSPLDATKLGIGIIYQELNLCPNLSVIDNVYLAREICSNGMIEQKIEYKHVLELINHLEQKIDPNGLVADLRIGQQQIVEIAKALAQDVRILIMDEPTSALSAAEVEVLFRIIRELKSRDVSIIYISHKLEELLQIGDHITVLRDGRKVAEDEAKNINVSWIIEKMVGRNPTSMFARKERQLGSVMLKVEDLTIPRQGGGFILDHISLDLHEGEILGVYGLMGAGRSDLVDCLAGAKEYTAGKITLNGEPITSRTVAERIDSGFVLVPEDRQRFGLVGTLSVKDNMLLSSLKSYLKGIFLSSSDENKASEKQVKELRIRVANIQQPITSLSGGNQQKVVVAKGLLTKPKVLLLDEPTRGIDVGAKYEIFDIMNQLVAKKFGVIFVSSELKEILAMSDRILVMSKGAITGEFSHEEATHEKLVAASAIGHGPIIEANRQGKGN